VSQLTKYEELKDKAVLLAKEACEYELAFMSVVRDPVKAVSCPSFAASGEDLCKMTLLLIHESEKSLGDAGIDYLEWLKASIEELISRRGDLI